MSSPQPIANQILPFKSSVSQKFLKYLKDLSDFEPTLIADLANQSEEALISTRNSAKLLGISEWRIQCAIDAEILSRATRLSGGRGNVDTEKVGKKSVGSKRAKAIGLTPRTIEKNAQVFALMQTESGVRANASLPDKEFYKVALRAVDSEGAIRAFAEKKIEDPHFKPSDAGRYLESNRLTIKIAKQLAESESRIAAGTVSIREKEIKYLDVARNFVTKTLLIDCPSESLRELFLSFLDDISNYKGHESDDDMTAALIKAWDSGYRREDEMATFTSIPLATVTRIMKMLDDSTDLFIEVPRAGEFKTWHKVGTPLPIELRGGAVQVRTPFRYDADDDLL